MVAYRASSHIGASSSSNYVAPAISGLVAGDVMLAIMATNSTTPTPPSGWASVFTTNGVGLFTKTALSADVGATFTFTTASAAFGGLGIHAYSGAQIDVSGAASGLVAPSVTATKTGLVIVRLAEDYTGSTSGTMTAPSGTTSRYNNNVSAGTIFSVASCADSTQSGSGTTGTATFTTTGGTNVTIAATVALYSTVSATAQGRRGFNEPLHGHRGRGAFTSFYRRTSGLLAPRPGLVRV